MDINQVRSAVGRIKANLFKNSNSFSIGMLKSQFKGVGLQFKEHQVYNHGDDVRFIDWKMVAKMGNPYIKVFEEERNVEIVVLIDAGPSMLNGVNGVSKLQAAIEICGLLFLLAKETNDFVELVMITDRTIIIPRSRGEEGIVRMISTLEDEGILTKQGKVNIARSFNQQKSKDQISKEILRRLGKKREVVLLSDFKNFLDAGNFKRILFAKNSHCFKIVGPLDLYDKFPFNVFSKGIDGEKSEGRQNSKEEIRTEMLWGKKVKTLNVKDRYLEEFIKEMI